MEKWEWTSGGKGRAKPAGPVTVLPPGRDQGLTLQLDLSVGVVQASVVCHCAGSLQVGQHHLHTVLRAAPGLGALGRGCVTLQQSDEGQDVRKGGVAQRGAFCRGESSGRLETLEPPHFPPPTAAHSPPRNRDAGGRGEGACLGSWEASRAPDSGDRSFLSAEPMTALAQP